MTSTPRRPVPVIKAVGGEFPLQETSSRPAHSLAGHLTDRAGQLELNHLASGREAIRQWLRNSHYGGRSTLLLPAYVCDSVVQAARTEAVWSVRFLPVGPDLSLVPDALAAAAREHGPRASLLAMPLFGLPYPPSTESAIEFARQLGVSIAWDTTHGLLSAWPKPDEPWVASLRKWCGIPDGGIAALSAAPRAEPAAMPASDPYYMLRLKGLRVKRDQLQTRGNDRVYLDSLERAEALLDADAGVRGMSLASRRRLRSVDIETIARRRRANARRLLAILDPDLAQPLVPAFGPETVPFGFPVLVKRRDQVRLALRARRIYCPIHWVLPSEVTRSEHATAHRVASHLMTIPCDERCTPTDMERVAAALTEVITRERHAEGDG